MISILYVDDEKTLLEVTKVYLERTGEFSVAICISAKEAIGILEAGSFDAVVSDYQMPGMDGLAFLKYLRSENNPIPFILFTGKGREEVAIEALNSGADFYLQKGGEPKSQFAELTNKIRQGVQRKQADKALLESEGRYRALFEGSADAIFVMGDRFLDCNTNAELLFGFNRSEIIGQTPEALSPPEQREGRASAELAAEYVQAARNGTAGSFPWIHRRKNGQTFPAQVSLLPAQVRGEQRIIAIVHDRTAETRDEKQFHHLARFPEMDPEPVIEVGAGGECLYANPACYTVLQKLHMPPQPAVFLPQDFSELVKEAGTTPHFTVYREVRIGTAIFGETLAYDPEDKTCRIFAHDITTRSFETGALEQANRKLNLLTGITRHDIKNKLTGVMGYIELARGSTRDPDLIEYLNRAELSAAAIRQQIEFTKEYENMGVKTPVWQDLSAVVDGVKLQLERSIVVINNEVWGLEVYADPMLAKVFCCLLENALTHGNTLTTIRIHGSDTPEGYLLLVEDDGVGIPKERKEKIFTKNAGKTGGFGLFLAREVLSITGMTIEETGEPGNGARFEISIPSGKFHIK